MATFYVGQRVRILWSENWPELHGQEGCIEGRITDTEFSELGCQWLVAPDAWGTSSAPRIGARGYQQFGPNGSQLEPILPSGHRACDADFKRDLDRLLERQGVTA
jgi:hypothetical protein